MFNEYDAVVICGFIIALISMLLNKIFDGILVVYSCQRQVDSLRALAQSNRPLLVQIGELYDIPWTEELDRADSLIHESATVSSYNFYSLYDISNRSTRLISEIYNKMKVVQLVAARAAAERGWEQRQRNPETEPADLPLSLSSSYSGASRVRSVLGSDSDASRGRSVLASSYGPHSRSFEPPHINLHLHLHSPSLPQKTKEQEHEEEKPSSGGPEDKKNEEKKRGNKFEKRRKRKRMRIRVRKRRFVRKRFPRERR